MIYTGGTAIATRNPRGIMPLYSFQCSDCQAEFETLVRSSDTPICPQCGSAKLERTIGSLAPAGKSAGLISAGRAQAAREGHFSNYSKSELKGLRK